jgi:signal transduction histidine kinase
LNNVTKHAAAHEVNVKLSYSPPEFFLQVEDDGVGIPEAPHGGLGLIAMRERAQMVGGVLTVARRPEKGTLVKVTGPADF